jgi:hypothetical protein
MRCKSYSRTCLILNSPQNRLGCRFYLPYEMCKEQCGLRMNRSFRGGAIGFTNALISPIRRPRHLFFGCLVSCSMKSGGAV